MSDKPLIHDFSYDELSEILGFWGEKTYRAIQVWQGLYRHHLYDVNQFVNLPLSLRDKLKQHYHFSGLHLVKLITSKDGTKKYLFELLDGLYIESVLIRHEKRNTLCISTQVGCAMGCVFCATGQMGFRRHLSSGEIIEQVLFAARELATEGKRLANVVLMGMGEPFHNYKASMKAIECIYHPTGFNLGQRHITISTIGIIPEIEKFMTEKKQVNLAVSLHAADNDLRSLLIPVNKKYPLKDLIKVCKAYTERTHRRISFEYALISDLNDTTEQARLLENLLGDMLCHVNVILLNPTPFCHYKPSEMTRAKAFMRILEENNIQCTLRISRGVEIRAGCGQLVSEIN